MYNQEESRPLLENGSQQFEMKEINEPNNENLNVDEEENQIPLENNQQLQMKQVNERNDENLNENLSWPKQTYRKFKNELNRILGLQNEKIFKLAKKIFSLIFLIKNFIPYGYYLIKQFDCLAMQNKINPTQIVWHNTSFIIRMILMSFLLINFMWNFIYKGFWEHLVPFKEGLNSKRYFSYKTFIVLSSFVLAAIL